MNDDNKYRTKLDDGTYLEPSVEYLYDSKGIRVAEASLIIFVVIFGAVFMWFILLKQGAI